MNALLRFGHNMIDVAARSHARAIALLLLFCALAFLPGQWSMQPMDRDEPRFAQATKQMLETGDYVDIRFQQEARHKKPVGIYWLQAATVRTGEALGIPEARTTIWLYRLPSLAGATLAVLLAYWACLVLMTRAEAFAAALAFGACILIGVEARLAKTDAVMSITAIVTFGIVARAWMLRRTSGIMTAEMYMFWVAIGVSALLKGPVIAMVVVLAMAVLSWPSRSLAWARPLWNWRGALVAALIVLPWFLMIAWKSGGAFFAESVGKDMLSKVGSGQEKHWGPPGLYTLIFPATFWPVAPLAMLAVPFVWRNRHDDVVRLCVAWIVPSWIVFEAVPTKLPHYVLPVYIAFAVLAVRSLALEQSYVARGWRTVVAALLPALPVLFAIAAIVATYALEAGGPGRFLPLVMAAPLFATAIALAVMVMRALRGNPGLAVVPLLALSTITLGWSVYYFAWPALRSIQLSPRLAAAAHSIGCPDPQIATVGSYREPSLVFLTRTDLAMLDGPSGAEFMLQPGCRVAFVDSADERAFNDALAAKGTSARLMTRIDGVNINRALEPRSIKPRRVDIGVYLRDTSRR